MKYIRMIFCIFCQVLNYEKNIFPNSLYKSYMSYNLYKTYRTYKTHDIASYCLYEFKPSLLYPFWQTSHKIFHSQRRICLKPAVVYDKL